jgi:type I restriction enzyme S subunit
MNVKPESRRSSDAWREVGVDDLKAPNENALSTGPFGSSIGSQYFEMSGVPVIRGSNLANDGRTHLIDDDLVFVSEAKASEFRRSMVYKGDLIFTCWGTINQVGLISHRAAHRRYIVSNKQMKFTPDQAKADSLFLFYLFSGPDLQRQISNQSIGTSVPGFNLGKLRALRFRVPSVAEQLAIAEVLSDADALIESLEQLIAKKRQIKQGAMQELLRPRKAWVPRRLGGTAILKARIGWQGLTTDEYLDAGDYYLVTGTDFIGGYIDWDNCHYVEESRYNQDRYIQLRQHDVLVTKDGTIGKVAFVTNLAKPATLNSGVFVIRPIEDSFDPRFFYYLLCSNVFTEFLVQLSAGSTINHLYQKDFVNFIYHVPERLCEQTAIAAMLCDMDAEIASLEAKVAKAWSIKQGMMQELLTGRIRLV